MVCTQAVDGEGLRIEPEAPVDERSNRVGWSTVSLVSTPRRCFRLIFLARLTGERERERGRDSSPRDKKPTGLLVGFYTQGGWGERFVEWRP